MALAGRRFAYGRGGFPGATSDSTGTTHARFGSEVEWKASNLVALLCAERSLPLKVVPAQVMAETA
jgi:hypothetical protein